MTIKKLIIAFFLITSIATYAQEATVDQKNKALAKATEFCNLLAQYSSNGDKFITNDAKIFDLCSSPNITAYNDIEDNKEDLLVSYLFSILGNYDCNLKMTFTQPKVEQVFGIPLFDIGQDVIGNFSCKIAGYDDTYIIVSTQQSTDILPKATDRKIIYSCNEDKIIAFTSQDSPYISLQKAFKAFSVTDYESVFIFADKVLAHKRFDHTSKNSAATIAMVSAFFSNDIEKISKYGKRIKDNSGFFNYAIGGIYARQGRVADALSYFELASNAGCEYANYMLGMTYVMPDTDFRSINKAKYYFEKGMNSTNTDVAGQSAHFYAIFALNMPEDFGLTDAQIIPYLKRAADSKYAPSYLPLSILLEESGDRYEAALMDENAYIAGSNVAMARLGHYLLTESDEELRKEGIRLLREASYTDIDTELEQIGSTTGLTPKFPQSLNEIKQLISKY